jgi:bifunctional non-homologous end joining protein LigD
VEYRFGDVVVACTNTDRVMFPDSGITKGEVLAYYKDVADVMVPELRGRPLTLDRYTKGIDKGGFFQKHWQKHFPGWIDRVAVAGKTPVTYPICDTPAALVYFANQGAIAFHVCTSRKAALDRPDEIVFDLDPPDGGFALVRRAARILHDLLGELGLPAFVKTSGSKGLHVVVPVDGAATYADAGLLCSRIAALLCAQHPDLLTTEFYKKDRKGRLFLDTMRNTFGATAVAAYSLRGRPGAPVSAPVGWHEVDDPALAPDGFTLRTMRDRLDAWGDPWRELRAQPGSIAAALTSLGNTSRP